MNGQIFLVARPDAGMFQRVRRRIEAGVQDGGIAFGGAVENVRRLFDDGDARARSSGDAAAAHAARTTAPAGRRSSLPAAAAMLSPGQSISLNAEVEHVSALASATLEISATDVSLSRTVRSASMINLDNIAPTTPNGLTATIAKKKQVKLAWLASTDASGIAKYQIYRNGVLITETTILSYTDTGASGTVTYQVFAIDRAGNKSLGSNQVSVSISSGTGGGGKGKPTR